MALRPKGQSLILKISIYAKERHEEKPKRKLPDPDKFMKKSNSPGQEGSSGAGAVDRRSTSQQSADDADNSSPQYTSPTSMPPIQASR